MWAEERNWSELQEDSLSEEGTGVQDEPSNLHKKDVGDEKYWLGDGSARSVDGEQERKAGEFDNEILPVIEQQLKE